MKKIFVLSLLLILIGLILNYKDTLLQYASRYYDGFKKEIVMDNVNEYYRDYDFEFVQNTKNFYPTNKQELLNVYYTIINSGNSEFTFYCPSDYQECLNDVQGISNDQTILSDINNYVHPFNSFKHVSTEYDSVGRVKLTIEKAYTQEEIDLVKAKVDELSTQLINPNDSTYNNILRVHDYIINNSKYDSDRSDRNIINYKSDIAYGPLFEGYAICGGYTDLMQLFLENLDLTWDDPIVNDGSIDYLEHNFFLIDTNKLHQIETTEHEFDYDRYSELKEA